MLTLQQFAMAPVGHDNSLARKGRRKDTQRKTIADGAQRKESNRKRFISFLLIDAALGVVVLSWHCRLSALAVGRLRHHEEVRRNFGAPCIVNGRAENPQNDSGAARLRDARLAGLAINSSLLCARGSDTTCRLSGLGLRSIGLSK